MGLYVKVLAHHHGNQIGAAPFRREVGQHAAQAADAVLHTYEGLRVPADALRVSEDGVTGVYCVDGENAAFRPVTLVYQGEGEMKFLIPSH